jgi:Flp pilus assembly pilin Flp
MYGNSRKHTHIKKVREKEKNMKHTISKKRGQGMTEYIIIVAIVAIAAIAVIGLFGSDIKEAFSRAGGAIEGNDVSANGTTYDATSRDMGDFTQPAASTGGQ